MELTQPPCPAYCIQNLVEGYRRITHTSSNTRHAVTQCSFDSQSLKNLYEMIRNVKKQKEITEDGDAVVALEMYESTIFTPL